MPNFGTPRRSITPSRPRTLTVRRIDISDKKETGHLCFWEILSVTSRQALQNEGHGVK